MNPQLEEQTSVSTPRTQQKFRPSAERLRELFDLDMTTGWLTWRESPRSGMGAGSRAGSLDKSTGYRRVRIDGVPYREHRVIWAYVTGRWPKPGMEIMHGNGERSNNSWDNLSLGTRKENGRDLKVPRSNTSGYMGVSWHERVEKWRSIIWVNGKQLYLGSFDNIEDAAGAYLTASIELGFHPDHGTRY